METRYNFQESPSPGTDYRALIEDSPERISPNFLKHYTSREIPDLKLTVEALETDVTKLNEEVKKLKKEKETLQAQLLRTRQQKKVQLEQNEFEQKQRNRERQEFYHQSYTQRKFFDKEYAELMKELDRLKTKLNKDIDREIASSAHKPKLPKRKKCSTKKLTSASQKVFRDLTSTLSNLEKEQARLKRRIHFLETNN